MKAIVSIKKGLAMILAAALTVGCISVPANATESAASPEAMTLEVGETKTLEVTPDTATPVDAHRITWSSNNSSVVSVSPSDGASVTITAETVGDATITATKAGTAYKTWNVSVVAKTQIGLDKTAITIKEGGSWETLTAIVTSGDGQQVTWTSSDTSAVIVSPDVGNTVNVIAPKTERSGTATVTATVKNKLGKDVKAECAVTITTDVIEPDSVSLNKTTLALKVGESDTLSATVSPPDAKNKSVTWTTSAPAVATVENGKVTAVAVGTAVITAKTVNGKTATCAVTVTAATTPSTTTAVQSVSLPATLALKVGQTSTMTATITPSGATNKKVAWTSSNPAVASIDPNTGAIKALANGQTIITVTTEDGGKMSRCTVTVTTGVASVSLNKTTLVVGKGAILPLTATVNPSTASNKAVTWTTSNKNVATVDANGKVKGVSKGTANITVISKDNAAAKSVCAVTVSEVTLNKTALTLGVNATSAELKATLSTTADAITAWQTSNANIVKVDSKTGKLTATNKTGTAVITVTTRVGAKATCTVTVKLVTTKLAMSSNLEIAKGKSATLKVTRTPQKATEKITWTSSNTKVATVNQQGKVTAKKNGTTTITAKSANGVSVTCKVVVKKASLKLKKAKGTVKVGKKLQIKVKSSFPKKDKIKSYKSSAAKIAKVDKKGNVTGKKKGTAKITVTTKSGAKAVFTVTVK